MRTRLVLFLLSASVGLLAGCQTAKPPLTEGQSEVGTLGRSGYEINGIFAADGSVEAPPNIGKPIAGQALYIEDLNARTLENGYKQIQARIVNKGSSATNAQYRFFWFDANGFELEQGTSGWAEVRVAGRESVAITGLARDASVKSFKIYVRVLEFKK